MGGFKQPSLNTIVPRSSLFFGEDLSASVKGETIDGRLSDEAIGFNIPFVGNEVGRSAEQSLSSNFPERLCFQIQGFMLHRVILSGMCPPSNPAGPSVEGGALLNARCTFMQKSGASPPRGGGLGSVCPWNSPATIRWGCAQESEQPANTNNNNNDDDNSPFSMTYHTRPFVKPLTSAIAWNPKISL